MSELSFSPVLVTGTAGFLGSVTLRWLRSRHIGAIGTARSGVAGCEPCDLFDTGALLDSLDRVAPDTIVNCTAVVDITTNVPAAPKRAEGQEANDQIIESSPDLPVGRPMEEALAANMESLAQ